MANPAGTKIVEEPKNVQTDHPVVPETRRRPEEAEKRAKLSVVSYLSGKCRKRPSTILGHFCKTTAATFIFGFLSAIVHL